jgi:hypothetical protein
MLANPSGEGDNAPVKLSRVGDPRELCNVSAQALYPKACTFQRRPATLGADLTTKPGCPGDWQAAQKLHHKGFE